MRFPAVETDNLNRRTFRLPDGLEGESNLLILAYEQWQQRQVDGWFPIAERLENEIPGFRFYELPVVGRMNAVRRFMLDNGMRAGIPNKETRARVLTLYVDRDAFNDQLGITETDKITLLLVTRDGQIHWREIGPWSVEKEAGLEQAIRSLAPPGSQES